MSALHIAVEKRDIDMVQFLLQSDSMNVDIETFAGFTPYQICYDEKIGRLLLDAGAENLPHAEDDNDMCLDSEDEDEEEEVRSELLSLIAHLMRDILRHRPHV
jgi:hypothetical protein